MYAFFVYQKKKKKSLYIFRNIIKKLWRYMYVFYGNTLL